MVELLTMDKFDIAICNHNFGIIDEWLNLLKPTRLRTKNGKLLKTADGKYLKVRN